MRNMIERLAQAVQLDTLAVDSPATAPRRRDWVTVGVLLVFLALETTVTAFDGDIDWVFVRVVPALISIGLLPWRRWKPVAAVLLAFSVEAAFQVAAAITDSTFEATFAHGVSGIVLFYALCRWATMQQLIITASAVAVFGVVSELAYGSTALQSVVFLVPWAIVLSFALSMRYRARLVAQQFTQVRLEERHALARELHDAVAHHVSAIAVQAQAAQFIAKTDPAAATDAMRSVEEIATATIDEMRRMVGILRSDDDQSRTVIPTSLNELIESPGKPAVSLTGSADISGLPAPIALAVYRVSQEAITNARRHSRDATFIDMSIETTGDNVQLIITNDGIPVTRNSGSGYGLVGMRERIEALGGTLTSAARPANGWKVEARIPARRSLIEVAT